ncbi:MAG: hypothetical protein MUD12_12900 [Spirochaetes bacterium]|nr:hypothetical protein [Spirochaetota bacterium]
MIFSNPLTLNAQLGAGTGNITPELTGITEQRDRITPKMLRFYVRASVWQGDEGGQYPRAGAAGLVVIVFHGIADRQSDLPFTARTQETA